MILTAPWEESFHTMFDTGQAAAYMQLAAWELGIGSCPITSQAGEAAQQLLGVPEQLRVKVGLSFGYPANLPRPARKGGRRTFDEVVHWETW